MNPDDPTRDLHPDHAATVQSLVAAAWRGLWHLAVTTPWVAIGLMVPALALLVGCTRLSLRRR